ncbi:hypothetical protein MJO29_016730, partial [Puccinia striiformis f. sp. tritici]
SLPVDMQRKLLLL